MRDFAQTMWSARNHTNYGKEILNLQKSEPRGKHVAAYDDMHRVLTLQWNDSKVVNVVTSVIDSSIDEATRQKGKERITYPCPTVLRKYQKSMFGVDKNDQMRAAGGGFAKNAHYKKCYKKGYFALLDITLLNSLLAWNLSTASTRNSRQPLKRHGSWIIDQNSALLVSATHQTCSNR